MKISKLNINTDSKSYSIIIGRNLLNKLNIILKKNKLIFNKCLIVIDSNIPNKHLSKINLSRSKKNIFIKKFKANEKNKKFSTVVNLLNLLFKNNFNRNDCVIAIGGGITGDIVGFVSSIYKRGLRFVNIPSTLLAQVDSSIGGKTGINNKYGKNLVGSFYQPDLVVSDISLLESLPSREIICGYGEIFKHSLISRKKNFLFLNKNLEKIIKLKKPFIEKAIIESCKVKKDIVQKDEKEKGLRKILNLGHTFAHAFEATLNFSKKLNHGEAVILGIKTAIQFSQKKKFISKKDAKEIINHIDRLKEKYDLKKFFKLKDVEKIIRFMRSDKKNVSSKINLILLGKINRPIVNYHFTEQQIRNFLFSLLQN